MKAETLKNAYLSGVADTLGAEAMSEAGAMENAKLAGKLGMEAAGEQAAIPLLAPLALKGAVGKAVSAGPPGS